jgi:hypothetical protein
VCWPVHELHTLAWSMADLATGTTWWDEAQSQQHHAVQHVQNQLQQVRSGGKPPLAHRGRRLRYQDTFDPGGHLAPVTARPRSPQHCAHKTASLDREVGGPNSAMVAHPSTTPIVVSAREAVRPCELTVDSAFE